MVPLGALSPVPQPPVTAAESTLRASLLSALESELASSEALLRGAVEASGRERQASHVLPLLLSRLSSHQAATKAISAALRRLGSHLRMLAPASSSTFAFDSSAAEAAASADLEATRRAVVAAAAEALPEALRSAAEGDATHKILVRMD